MMGGLQVTPDDIRVPVEPDESVAVGSVAGPFIDGQDTAILQHPGLAHVHVAVRLRVAHGGLLVPDLAERLVPLVQHFPVGRDEIRRRRMPGRVESRAGADASRQIDGHPARIVARGVPEIRHIHVVVQGELGVNRLAAFHGSLYLRTRRNAESGQDRPGKK
jgi:hypothetical protein